jgi:hypothetical protein
MKVFFKRAPIFFSFVRERKRGKTKMMEEYCWAITWAAGGHAAAGEVPLPRNFDFS